jgi:hypothetical protein
MKTSFLLFILSLIVTFWPFQHILMASITHPYSFYWHSYNLYLHSLTASVDSLVTSIGSLMASNVTFMASTSHSQPLLVLLCLYCYLHSLYLHSPGPY